MKRLVVVPSDPIAAYETAGYDWLERYYNPQGFFDEVYALSPLEQGERQAYGMTIMGVAKSRFVAVLRSLKPDVVRAYGGYWPADLVTYHRLPDVPVMVSVHDTAPSSVHRAVCYADLVLCVSQAVATEVLKRGTDPKRIRLLPNRIDGDIFHPIADKSLWQPIEARFPPGKHILHVGRRSEQKNLDTLIRALSLLPAEYSCVFIGKGDQKPYLALAERTGVSARCFWIEAVPNSELPLWYSWCDCMCTPSRWEGFGIVFIEAAACGTPIVTSDIAPMNEYLNDGDSACLVQEYENPQALADAILKVCDNIEYRQRLTAGAVAAAQPFERHAVDAAEVAIYQEAMQLQSFVRVPPLELAKGWAREMIADSGVPRLARGMLRGTRHQK